MIFNIVMSGVHNVKRYLIALHYGLLVMSRIVLDNVGKCFLYKNNNNNNGFIIVLFIEAMSMSVQPDNCLVYSK